jgi:hypothetical protein
MPLRSSRVIVSAPRFSEANPVLDPKTLSGKTYHCGFSIIGMKETKKLLEEFS